MPLIVEGDLNLPGLRLKRVEAREEGKTRAQAADRLFDRGSFAA